MKKIYIIRHALAGVGEDTPEDKYRIITNEGRCQSKRIGEFLASLQEAFVTLYSSEYTRAKQTGEIVCQNIGCTSFVAVPWLNIGVEIDYFCSALKENILDGSSILVMHEPTISNILAFISNGDENFFKIEKGSITCLAENPETGEFQLIWSIPIDILD